MAAQSHRWTSVLDAERRIAALKIANDVARRNVDRSRIATALARARQQTQFPGSVSWQPYAVASGEAGIAMMCSYLDRCEPGQGWDVIGHELLAAGARAVERLPTVGAGLFGGLSGFALAVESLSKEGTRYQRLLAALDEELVPRVSAMTAGMDPYPNGMGVGEFDLVSGLSGIGAYLLQRDPGKNLPDLLTSLVWLTERADEAPRWATPPELLETEMRDRFPSGNLNCGLAHGIPGPLAVLALTLEAGLEVRGQADAVHRVAEWLVERRTEDEWGINWPSVVPVTTGRASSTKVAATRDAWCYGTPGLARALWLAGEALDDDNVRGVALEAMFAVLRRPIRYRYIDSPTFCHGVAGLLQIVLRFAHDTRQDAFREAAGVLVDQLIAAYQPDRPLGYASLEPGPVEVDRPGLLDGAPGIAMVLLAAATDTEPTWDRVFALS